MTRFVQFAGGLEWHTPGEVLRIEPWGADAVRVRATAGAVDLAVPGALEARPPDGGQARTVIGTDGTAEVVCGRLTVRVGADGRIRFLRTGTGHELLAEKRTYTWHPGPRVYAPRGDGTQRLEQLFEAYPGERIYGLGQQLHGSLDQKGYVIDLVQLNTAVTIPFLYSSRGYGLLWNNPAMGRVELGADTTRWVADDAAQIDYWVTAGDRPADVMAGYADATGHPPLLPAWATGFWQSRLRYRTQDELLSVAGEYHARGLPISVIVCDFFHWPRMGDWRFAEEQWPDPAGMVAQLRAMGVRLMVSIWPTVDPDSENFHALRSAGGLVADEYGGLLEQPWPARGKGEAYVPTAYYDATDPGARRFLWDQVREHYHELGVEVFWLDACEPDLSAELARRARYAVGPGTRVGNLYALMHAQGFAEGQRAAGNDRPLNLIRAAWAGSQRHGAALWSGDIPPTFDSLSRQVRAGLNVGLSGIPWWNADVGGFQGGDPTDPAYQELMVRWFQYATFSPLLRLHGDREPNQAFTAEMTGGPNEVWSYGEVAYPILCAHLRLRERLHPYLMAQSEQAHRTGAPPMRPLFFDFPEDERAWSVDDQFLLGPDVLVAPITVAGARDRLVYLPDGCDWVDVFTGTRHGAGATVHAPAPLEHIPVFVREQAVDRVGALIRG